MGLRWWSSCKSNSGRVRKINEDAFLEIDDLGVWMVADGMGGHEKGDVASRIVADSFNDFPQPNTIDEFSRIIRKRLMWANQRVQDLAAKLGAHRIMGSTVVALCAFKGQCVCLWAGDSRAYLMRDGRLQQISRDHNLAEELVQRGELKREETASHPTSSRVTRAVGVQQTLKLDERRFELRDGDSVLLCTDGLNKEVSDEEIQTVLDSFDCEEASQEFMDLTLERGARDNVTVAVIRFETTTGFGDTEVDDTAINPTLIRQHRKPMNSGRLLSRIR